MPKFEGVSLFESLVVSAVGAKARERKVHLAVELEFLGDDFKGSGTLVVAGASMGTTNHFFRDGVLYIFDVVGEVVWGFGYLVVLDVGVAPAVSFSLASSLVRGKYSWAMVSLYAKGESSGGKNSP